MAREIKEDVLLELSRDESERGDAMVLRVVSWNNGTPKLEKRSFWKNDQEEVRTGKITGITAADFQLLLEKKDEVLAALSADTANDATA